METRSRREFVAYAALLAGAPMALNAKAAEPANSGYLIIYGPGPAFLPGKPLGEQPLKEHFAYMLGLHKRGVLRMAGGFADDSGGAAFISAQSLDEARQIAEADPAVTSKVFVYRLQQWNLVPWEQIAAGKK